jgi:filamentous hemagglutinin family protein
MLKLPYLAAIVLAIAPVPALAQIVPANDGTGTTVNPNGDRIDIRGGQRSQDDANLFHSFREFGLDDGQIANFISDPEIRNILGRINGNNPSVIDGLIRVTGGDSNLYLMNPSGIIFGASARLDVPASFFATTATGMQLDGGWFNARGTSDYAALLGTPQAFRFDSASVIANAGILTVPPEHTLGLLGGTVLNTGQLNAPGGQVLVTAVGSGNTVRLSQPGHLLGFDIQPSGDPVTPLSLPELLTGSLPEGGLTVDADGNIVAAAGDGTIANGRINARNATIAAENNLAISDSTLATTENLTVRAGNTLQIRDGNANAGNTLTLRGDRAIDILALANLEVPPFTSGGDFNLVSSGTISADSHFASGGNLSVLTPTGQPGHLVSLYDPIVRVAGDITFGNYTGAALKIEAGGSISGGDITITEPDAALSDAFANDPDFAILTSFPALILRAGVAPTATMPLPDGFASTTPASSPANITVGEITTASETGLGGPAILSATGAIATGNIITFSATEPGGTINLGAQGNITADSLISGGGDIIARSIDGAIATGDINAASLETGGNVTVEAGDRLQTGAIDTSGLTGTGGNVQVNAGSDAEISSIDARGATSGGDIDLATNPTLRVLDLVATGIIQDTTASIATSPGSSIRIQQQLDAETPTLTVGDSSINGTAGDLTTEVNTLTPPFSAPIGTFEQGEVESSSKITIITQRDTPSLPETSEDLKEAGDAIERELSPTRAQLHQPQVELDEPTLDGQYATEFEFYLDLPPTPPVSLSEAANILAEVERTAGVKPAIIYVNFVPTGAALNQSGQLLQVEQNPQDYHLELLMVTSQRSNANSLESNQNVVRVSLDNVSKPQVLDTARQLRNNITSPIRRRTNTYLQSAQQLYDWIVSPLAAELQQREIENIVFIMDSGLRSLPIAAMHDGEGFLVESYSLGLMPSLSLTDTRYSDIRNSKVLAMGASQFQPETGLQPLPAVPLEIEAIGGRLWPGDDFLNQAFTLKNLRALRQRTPYGIIHLATHAEFKAGDPSNSYVQLWDSRLSLDRLRTLGWNDPPVNLLVLSACRTAVGSEQAELGFAGLAVAAGVKSALGSLWYVSDEGTVGLMTEFYRQLRQAPIKAEALRQAQLAMIRGNVRLESGELRGSRGTISLPPQLAQLGDRNLSHPYYWSAFTLIGNPW